MKASSVARLYELCRRLAGGNHIINEGGEYSFPLHPTQLNGLWVKIDPDTHNSEGKYTRSATLKVYERSGPTCFDQGKLHIELQALESPDERIPQDILVIQNTLVDPIELAPFFEHLRQLIPGSSFASLNAA